MRAEEQTVCGSLPALLRTLQRRRPHRIHLAHRRPGNVPLRHHQVGHVMRQVLEKDTRHWFSAQGYNNLFNLSID